MMDFKGVYSSTRCLLEHTDPYNPDQLRRAYLTEGGARPSDFPVVAEVVARSFYPPTSFVLTLPFALLPYGPAHVLWFSLTAALFIFAAFLIWKVCSQQAPVIAGILIALLLANSASLLVLGNPAGIALGLCVIAVWCFTRGRAIAVGIVCMAISLAVKPNDAGPIWLCFLLAGASYRRRSIRTLVLVIAMCVPVVVWVSSVAPHWPQEQQSNLQVTSTGGDLNDPSPASPYLDGLDTLIQLQTITSIFWDSPRSYNAASWLICAPLLLAWVFVALRSRSSPANMWLALAAAAALSVLPVYHRTHDARILLLTVPACAMLWAERAAARWLAIFLNAAASLSMGEIASFIRLNLAARWLPHFTGLCGKVAMVVLERPVPLLALCMAVFYLWLSFQRVFRPDAGQAESMAT